MTREEAINVLEKQFDKSCGNYRYQNAEKLDFEDALWMAISALRQEERFGEANKTLTLDELRKMDGEPVLVSVSNNWRESGVSEGWCLVRFHSEDDRVQVYIYDTRHGARFFAQQDYGISWFAYRQKPEEGTA